MANKGRPVLVDVEVSGLFGHFDHKIPFPADWDFVIIHGVNGVGKTKVLDLIRCLTTGNFTRLAKVPFREAKLTFSDGSRITAKKSTPAKGAASPGNHPELDITLTQRNRKPQSYTVPAQSFLADERMRDMILQLTPLVPVDEDTFLDRSGELLSIREVLEQYGPSLPARAREYSNLFIEIPSTLRDYWQASNVYFIETQRLLSLDHNFMARRAYQPDRAGLNASRRVPTVKRFSDDVAARIQKALSELGQRSQELDRTFPNRLVRPRSRAGVPDESDVRRRYNEQLKLRRRLTGISVLDAFGADLQLPKESLDPVVLRVMTEFLTDSEEKFKVVEPLLDRLELLTGVLNKKFQYKDLTVDRHEGFVVVTQDGERVRPDQLSSGEQHELVLLYDLLFGAKDEALVLIDEPEISLHVNWQKSFLSDLREVSTLARHRFIVATHSPSIIGRYSDRMVRLEGRSLK